MEQSCLLQNEQLFFLSKEFMDTLNAEKQLEGAFVSAALAKFKIHFLDVLGFGVWVPADMSLVPNHFSNTIGGFVGGRANADAYAIDAHTWELFNLLKQSAWHALPVAGELAELQHILSNFIEFQLEREIKSEHYLEQY
jgi:recombinational DNA repair protein (RecF pathway)